MNKIKFSAGSLVLIRDTLTNEVMPGAKDQLMFPEAGHAKRSAGHTGWWSQYSRFQYLASIGKASMTERLTELQEEARMCMEKQQLSSYYEIDQSLRDEIQKASTAINKLLNKNYSALEKFKRVNTFAKQTRYIVEEVVELFTQTIVKRRK